jgi:periplasmic protein TonB
MRVWPSVLIALAAHGLLFLVPGPAQEEVRQRQEEIRFVILPPAPEASAPVPMPEPKPEPPPKPKPVPAAEPVSLPVLPLLKSVPAPAKPVEATDTAPLAPPVVSTPALQAGPVRTSFDEPEGPRFRERVVPEYPMRARRMNREGVVTLELHIDEGGRLLEATLLEGAGFGMDEAALRAVRQSTYFPARHEGRPVASRAVLNVRFQFKE